MIQWSQVKKTCTENVFVYLRIFSLIILFIFFFHGLIFHTETQFTDNSEYSEAISVWNLL